VVKNALSMVFPLLLGIGTMAGIWWYVVIHQQVDAPAPKPVAAITKLAKPSLPAASGEAKPGEEEKVEALGNDEVAPSAQAKEAEGLQEMGSPELAEGNAAPSADGPPKDFYLYFGMSSVLLALLLAWYYRQLHAEQFVILKLLIESVMPLGLLTILVLAVILLGICTATESAAVGAAGAFLLAIQSGSLDLERTKQSLFLTAKTTAMVCWLFVGSALFSAVFAILGGQQIVEQWVLSLNMTPLQFMLLSQAIIFVLGWPLEWTEIIVIFVPIFLPMLKHFGIDPILWGTLVFVNLQAAFLSPPVAMSAFYLKGVSPPHVTLNQIFAGMMPYMFIVILCMVFMYIWPGMTLWLPNYLYGGG
jgi:TRAP-type mannitol/chloroaromatic compound transport system permease large subunit